MAYGGHKALKDITVDIPDGQITAIIGPSGCGKTTLLKSLNRLIELYEEADVEGEVLVDGENIYSPKADVLALRKKIGFLSQKPYPLPMSIYENISFGPRIHGVKGKQILSQINGFENNFDGYKSFEEKTGKTAKNGEMNLLVECYLRLAGLWDEVKDRLHTPASKLSVGQQQRLALARALSVKPEVILADEPTSALDPVSSHVIEKQFQALKSKYTIVLVTHTIRQARRIADNVIFLYLGELIEQGPANKVLCAPCQEKTCAYVSGEIS